MLFLYTGILRLWSERCEQISGLGCTLTGKAVRLCCILSVSHDMTVSIRTRRIHSPQSAPVGFCFSASVFQLLFFVFTVIL